MTDNEIIKALECCRDCNCKECPCCRIIDGGTHCTGIDEEQILDLINRLKAENEALINGQETLQKYIAEKNAEVERLKWDLAFREKQLHNLAKEMTEKE